MEAFVYHTYTLALTTRSLVQRLTWGRGHGGPGGGGVLGVTPHRRQPSSLEIRKLSRSGQGLSSSQNNCPELFTLICFLGAQDVPMLFVSQCVCCTKAPLKISLGFMSF